MKLPFFGLRISHIHWTALIALMEDAGCPVVTRSVSEGERSRTLAIQYREALALANTSGYESLNGSRHQKR